MFNQVIQYLILIFLMDVSQSKILSLYLQKFRYREVKKYFLVTYSLN